MPRRTLIGLAVLALTAQHAAAQAWDAPAFMPSTPQSNLGIYVVDPERSEPGAFLLWRRGSGNTVLGLRAGAYDADDPAFMVGADVGQTLVHAGDFVLIDIAATLGLGATFDDGTFARLPAGLSFGRAFRASDWIYHLYVHPRFALDIDVTDEETESDVTFTTDIGADLYLSTDFVIRLGITVGDINSIGVGIAATGGIVPRVAAR